MLLLKQQSINKRFTVMHREGCHIGSSYWTSSAPENSYLHWQSQSYTHLLCIYTIHLQYATVQFDKVHAKRLLSDPKWDFRCLTCNRVFFIKMAGWFCLWTSAFDSYFLHQLPNIWRWNCHCLLFHTWATLINKTKYLTRDRTPLASMAFISIILYLLLYSWSCWLYGIFFSLTIHSQELTSGLIALNC